MNVLRFLIYDFIWLVSSFFISVTCEFWPLKIQAYLKERRWPQLVWRVTPRDEQRRIWFHAASGEIEYIKPLLRLWKMKNPDDLLFLTYFSTSARGFIPSLSEIDGWAPLPMDRPREHQAFIEALKPQILIISRTDLWPRMLFSLRAQPKLLVASTWSHGNLKTKGLGLWITRWCLQSLNQILVVSNEDQKKLESIVPKLNSISVTKDPRYDQVQWRLNQGKALPSSLQTWARSSNFTFLAGSTWAEDDDALIEAWRQDPNDDRKWIIVPHETDDKTIQKLEDKLNSSNLSFSRWSQWLVSEAEFKHPILIFDEKGWLAELYTLADVAFIGGSFKCQVHSVMEALGTGCPVIVGPHYENNREALLFRNIEIQKQRRRIVEVAVDAKRIADLLKNDSQLSRKEAEAVKLEIQRAFLSQCGGTKETYEEIQKWL